MSQPVLDELTSIPKSTTDFICGRSWSRAFTSGVTMEKSPFSMVARRRGPKEGRSISGMVFPRPFLLDDFISKRKYEDRPTFGVLFCDDHGDLQQLVYFSCE
jgi:hypothetical protein